MSFSTADYLAMVSRLAKNSGGSLSFEPSKAVLNEIELHNDIVAFCNIQFPRWKYIRARSDRESTIAVGCQDFTIFIPDGKVLCVECKRKNAKPTIDQLSWHKEMEMLGHKVHVIYSMEDFRLATQPALKSPSPCPSPAESQGPAV